MTLSLLANAPPRDLPALSVSVSDLPGGAVRVQLDGELDMLTAPVLMAALSGLGAPEPDAAATVRLDVDSLTFVDSAGLRAIEAGRTTLNHRGWRLCITEPQPQVLRLLDLAVLFGWFPGDLACEDIGCWGRRHPSRLTAAAWPEITF